MLALAFVFLLPFLAPEGMRNALLGPHADEPLAIRRVDADEHLDVVAPVRYVYFVAGVVHGDFGRSYVQDVDVERDLAKRARLTILLVVLAVVLTRNAFGPAAVFGVLAVEALARLPGLGRVLADAVDVRDFVMVRAVLAVALLGCVALPRVRRVAALGARSLSYGWTAAAWLWLFVLSSTIAFAQRLPLAKPDALSRPHAGPSWSHWLGTDDVGRDVLSRLVWGAQGTLLLCLAATIAGCVIGVIAGAVAGEAPRARRAFAWLGSAGIPAVGISVGLAFVLSRQPFVMWQWLVPVTIGPALGWAAVSLGNSPFATEQLSSGVGAVADALANAVIAEAMLGALGCAVSGSVTWGVLLDDVRLADHRVWLELAAVAACVAVTVLALRAVAVSLRRPSRRLTPTAAGTMAA